MSAHPPTAPAPAPGQPGLPGWRPLHVGKVRELYTAEDDDRRVLVVATDRISAFDHVLATPVPDKGALLTALSLWWFEQLASWDLGAGSHVIGTDGVPQAVAGRAMVCRRLDMLPVECIARGYLTGSGLADYLATGAVGGVELPLGLQDGDRLRVPVFTPSTKAPPGQHDENTNLAGVAELVGEDLATRLRDVTLAVYRRSADLAAERGVIVADTKLELGLDPALDPADPRALTVGDELLTPDSSRFWPADAWAPGRPQPSFDKQYVRDWLTSPVSGWHRGSVEPPPPLPDDVVERTRARYVEAYERLTGRTWA